MVFRCRILCALLFFLSSFCFAHRWPYNAVPFSCSKKGGFFLSCGRIIKLHNKQSFVPLISHNSMYVVAPGKKSLQLNKQQGNYDDVTLFSKQLYINGVYPCDAIHCISRRFCINGYFFNSMKKIKTKQKDYQQSVFINMDQLFASWHKKEQDSALELEATIAESLQQKSIVVRVLLAQVDNVSSVVWKFSSPKGFVIRHVAAVGVDKKIICNNDLTMVIRKGCIICNGKKVNHAIKIEPLCGYSYYDGIAYDGSFCIAPDETSVMCINHVDLEDYITAVLKTESWPGWPLEVNKAFAITCRSYVASKIFEAKKSGRLYHVKNTNAHQTYRGRHDVAVLRQAVEHTKGIVLGFNKKPILAMFDSCCGGIIPAHIADFDFEKVPYLARTYACTHCKQCSLYSWMVSYESNCFEEMVKKYVHAVGHVHDIHVVKKDKAGLALEIKIKGPRGHIVMSGKQVYSLLKEVKSFHFDIRKKSGIITVSGRGFGHHIGLCQWGARQMVRDGWDYVSILHYYYPQTNFMKLV